MSATRRLSIATHGFRGGSGGGTGFSQNLSGDNLSHTAEDATIMPTVDNIQSVSVENIAETANLSTGNDTVVATTADSDEGLSIG